MAFANSFLHVLSAHSTDFLCLYMPQKAAEMLHCVQPASSSVPDDLLHSLYEKAFALL